MSAPRSPTTPSRCAACGSGRRHGEITAHWDRWPTSVTWSRDGKTLIVTADDNGRGPIFLVDPDTGAVTKLTDDDHTYTDVTSAPGGVIYAIRHGGPLSSWNGWHWRWNPWLMVAHGYAVLLPDPALSTGYGQDFIQRGWVPGARRPTPT